MLPRFASAMEPYCISVCVFTSNGSSFAFGLEIWVYLPGLRFGMELTVAVADDATG